MDPLWNAFHEGRELMQAGRFEEAIPFLCTAVELGEEQLGPGHYRTATFYNNLAEAYRSIGRYREAEPLYERALEISNATLPPEHPEVGALINNLGLLYHAQARYGDAGRVLEDARRILEKRLGPDDPAVAVNLNNLAELHSGQGLYDKAEPLFERALSIARQYQGSDQSTLALILINLAKLREAQGRLRDAETIYRNALTINERSGLTHPYVAKNLNGLARLHVGQGRHREAESLLWRAYEIAKKAHGRFHPEVAVTVQTLARIYLLEDRFEDAEPLLQFVLESDLRAYGPDHPFVAGDLNDLAWMYESQGRYEDAEASYRRGLAVAEAASALRVSALLLDNLARLYRVVGRLDEAERLHLRASDLLKHLLGPNHPDVAVSLGHLARLYAAQGRRDEALSAIRRFTSINRARIRDFAEHDTTVAEREQLKHRPAFVDHVAIAQELLGKDPARQAELVAETFEVCQLAAASGTSRVVSRMAARFAAGNDALAGLVRAQQDTLHQLRKIDARLLEAIAAPPAKRSPEGEDRLRAKLTDLERRLAELDDRLAADYPAYAGLLGFGTTSLRDAQMLLRPDEALLVYLVSEEFYSEQAFLWVVRPDQAAMHRLPVGSGGLREAVSRLRGGLVSESGQAAADLPPFDLRAAHDLYQAVLGPAAALLGGVGHLLVVPDGPLQSLPFGVLVTEAPDVGTDVASYRKASWLARRFATTALPSVSSLPALRRHARRSAATKRFIGFGDPALDGRAGIRQLAASDIFAGGEVADVDLLRRLDPLPETALELYGIADSLEAPAYEVVFLQRDATETRLRSMNAEAALKDYQVMAFATHALVAGKFQGATEPGLVLSPPKSATPEDDGFLAASEIVTLELDADWVVLSACNTADPDGTPRAEGFSGLAKAFFYAGSRALLVSHWEVKSDAAVALTTGTFKALAEDPTLSQSEALRRSMVALLDDADTPHFAHPLFWAPFVLVGEGAGPQG